MTVMAVAISLLAFVVLQKALGSLLGAESAGRRLL